MGANLDSTQEKPHTAMYITWISHMECEHGAGDHSRNMGKLGKPLSEKAPLSRWAADGATAIAVKERQRPDGRCRNVILLEARRV